MVGQQWKEAGREIQSAYPPPPTKSLSLQVIRIVQPGPGP